MTKKRTKIILLSAAVALVALWGAYAYCNAQRPEFAAETGAHTVAVFPLRGGKAELLQGIDFSIDTGSVVSLLTEEDAKKLEDGGATVKREWFPSIGRDYNGRLYLTFHRYRVDLPVSSSTRLDRGESNTIRNIIFLPAPKGGESVMGTDVLERFLVEYRSIDGEFALHKDLPQNYNYITSLESPLSTAGLIGCGQKYYIGITAENVDNSYLIDTGIDSIHLKLPMADTLIAKSEVVPTFYRSPRGEVEARRSDRTWVRIGNRAGSHAAFYSNDGDEPYAMNPFTFFSQDVLIDFAGRGIYMRPHTRRITL